MLNVMGLKSKVTGAVALGLTCLPPALHYAAVGYLEAERYAMGAAYHAKLEALRYIGLQPIPSQQSIDDMIDAAADKYGIKRELLHAVAVQESKKDPTAYSPKSATGVLQIMPQNYKRCDLPHAGRLWLEEHNIDCGARILSEELKTFGNVTHALAAYNWGSGNVTKWLKNGGKMEHLPAETRGYIAKIMTSYGKLSLG